MANTKKTEKSDVAMREAPTDGAATVHVTQETLDATPARLLTFLRGVGTRPAIQLALAAVGYDDAEHRKGWSLLHACSGYEPGAQEVPLVDRGVSEAIAALDAADERVYGRVEASLRHRAPAVHSVLLEGIKPGQGASSVVFFRVLLDRIDQLEKGTFRGPSKSDAKAALELLARRGITPSQRADWRALVTTAERFSVPEVSGDVSAAREALRQRLVAARAWYEEWSEIARGELKRKDYLLVLGLAQRKRSKPAAAKGGDEKPLG